MVTTDSIATMIETWLQAEHTAWELNADVVKWARAYGIDARRAWLECPRADHLMALAGALDARREQSVHAAAAAARDALQHVPPKLAVARKAVHLAESYRPTARTAPPKGSGLAEQTLVSLGDLDAQALRLHQAVQATGPGMAKCLVDVCQKLFEDGPAANVPEAISKLLADPAVNKCRLAISAYHLFLAKGHAMRAAAASVTVAESASNVDTCEAILGMGDPHTMTAEALLERQKIEVLAARSTAGVFTEGALVFEHAAKSFGYARAGSDEIFLASVSQQLTAMLYTVAGKPHDEVLRLAPQIDRTSIAIEFKLAKLLEFAERARTAIPVPLRVATASAVRDAEGELRDGLRRVVITLAAALNQLGYDDAASAHETALAILDAPGRLDRPAMRRVMKTLSEKMAEVFRQRAAETTGSASDQASKSAAGAEEAVREMTEMLRGTVQALGN